MAKPPSRYRAFRVVLDGREQHALTVRRAPPFVRFVVEPGGSPRDCLDQLDDEPKPGERVVAAKVMTEMPVHFKFSGKDKAKSGWYLCVHYNSVEPQPPEAVLRQTDLWWQWCLSQPRLPST